MPNTYVSLPGFDVDDKDIETQKVQNAVARVRFINEEITSRAQMKQYNCHEGALPFTKSYLLRPLFNAFLMSPKPFHATEACIGCKKCEKVCPVGNITVTDRPVWGGNCTQCLACYHVCPVHAVEYGKMTGKRTIQRKVAERFYRYTLNNPLGGRTYSPLLLFYFSPV